MNIFNKIRVYFKYRKKTFKYLGENVDYKQKNSTFRFCENIRIEKNSKILDYAYFDGIGGINIGQCTIIAPYVTILTSNHNYKSDEKITLKALPFDKLMHKKEVNISSYCWIARNVMIMPGVSIGKASIVAGGSVVVKDVPPYSIVGGNPARVIGVRDKEEIESLILDGKCINIMENSKEYI